MAGIDVGGHGGKRALNQEIPLVPFIDFLLCLVMFLLVTAVWSHMGRLQADSKVPSPSKKPTEEVEENKDRTMHVDIKAGSFYVYWTTGASNVPVTSFTVTRNDDSSRVGGEKGGLLYTELGEKIRDSCLGAGADPAKGKLTGSGPMCQHLSNDKKKDKAMLHSRNEEEFQVIAAVIDALNFAQRKPLATEGGSAEPAAEGEPGKLVPAFSVSFAL